MDDKRERVPAVAVLPCSRDLPVELTGARTAWGLFGEDDRPSA